VVAGKDGAEESFGGFLFLCFGDGIDADCFAALFSNALCYFASGGGNLFVNFGFINLLRNRFGDEVF
jgi:hypothetical protein